MILKHTLLFILLCILSLGFGQFGQNIVQYDDFTWYFIQSKHFDIYYTENGRSHAEFTAEEAEVAYLKISDRLNWRLKQRVTIIIYNSHNDFQQTNVVDSYMYEGIGGVTELYKNRVVIPFDASHREFKHVIHHELVHAFINDCVYGGNLRNMVSKAIKIRIPMWMNEGLAEYLASGWDTNSEMWIRDMAINGGELPDIKNLNGYMAYRGGQSVWNFITDKWGEESISEIIFQIKKSKNLETGIQRALGVDYKKLNEQWHQYLKEIYWPDVTVRDNILDVARQLTNHEELENTYNVAPAISPDGSRIAIFSNKSGPMALYLISADDGHFIKRILQGERNTEFEELHILKPGITWSPKGDKIALAAKSGKSDALFIVNLATNKKTKHRLDMEGIFRPAWRPGHNEIAFIGNNGKSSDIYIYSLDSGKLINLTQDWFTDDQISWHPDGHSLYFISDRNNRLETGIINKPGNHPIYQTDIYRLEIESGLIERITNSNYNEMYPCVSSDGNMLAYISDKSGINNIYLQGVGNAEPKAITNVITGITQLSWNGDDSQLIFTGFYNRGYDIYTLDNPLQFMDDSIKIPPAGWTMKSKDTELIRSEERKQNQTFITEDRYRNYIFSGFDATDQTESQQEDVFLDTTAIYDSTGLHMPHLYKTRFTLDSYDIAFSFDTRFSNKGMAYFFFSDILGDHKIQLGTEMTVNLQTSDYFLLYRLLPYKIDWNFVFYHLAYQQPEWYNEPKLFQDLGTRIEASKPLSRFNRVNASVDIDHIIDSKLVYTGENYYGNSEYELSYNNSFTTVIPRVKYVWDNTLWAFMHPVDGSRYYLQYRTSPGINKKSLTFHSTTFDGRKYFPLFNGISVASRFFGGTNWGPDAQKFRLGGSPWLISSESMNILTPHDDDQETTAEELYFSEYVMPIRGVPLSGKLGQNVLLVNLELRLPFLVYYFPAIKYLGQINGVIFTDIGVAWNADSEFPSYDDRSYWKNNTETGWLMSYGFGPRFIFLGVPWQLDYAWQYTPHKGTISDRKWSLSIGLDY